MSTRAVVLDTTLELLKSAEEKYGVSPRVVLTFIMKHYANTLTAENKEYADVRQVGSRRLRRVRVSDRVNNIALDIAVTLDLTIYAVYAFIVENTLPSMLHSPEIFPDFVDLVERYRGEKTPRKYQVSLAPKVAKHLKKRRDVHALDDPEYRLSLADMVAAMEEAWPPDTFDAIIAMRDLDVIDRVGTVGGPGTATIPVSFNLHNQLVRVKEARGIPMSRTLSYLVRKELKETEMEITAEGHLLPRNIRETYIKFLRHQLYVAPSLREESN